MGEGDSCLFPSSRPIFLGDYGECRDPFLLCLDWGDEPDKTPKSDSLKAENRPEKAVFGSPNGFRTRVSGVRGQYPRPLDDGTVKSNFTIIWSFSDIVNKKETIGKNPDPITVTYPCAYPPVTVGYPETRGVC